MAKRLILVVGFWLLLFAPALADEWVCFEGYQIEEDVAPASAMAEGSDEGATTDSFLFFEMIQPYTNYPTLSLIHI